MLKGFVIIATLALPLLGCSPQTPTEDPLDWWRIQCDELHSQIIGMSQDDNPFSPEILKFTGGIKVNRTGERLDCFGEVRTTNGEFYIRYYLEKDSDGDEFIGYELEPP